MKRNLRDMVVVITGASAGIGRALAVELAGHETRLALAARRLDRLEALNGELGGQHLPIQADVSRPQDCRAMIDRAVSHFGRIDTLVCNAGYGILRRVVDTSAEEELRMFQTNVLGTTECIRRAVPLMLAQDPQGGLRGQVVIVSSAAARRGLPFFGMYSATKAAQLSLAEALRVELRGSGIAVTSVHPIGTDTDFFATAEGAGDGRLPPRTAVEPHQTPQQVARKIVAGIRRPRPEVWPFRPSRLALTFATLAPRLTDWIMSRSRGAIERHNQNAREK